ncbi:MAG: hypothetical protein P9L92_14310 [Candidatus Electryonea clarkiae]|nr:hypothetical protein [Candidatus Electryonea clarkiae]MDP8287152.1 hypothetical protein [Candidatus Electryonea clarkiae]
MSTIDRETVITYPATNGWVVRLLAPCPRWLAQRFFFVFVMIQLKI